MYITFLIGNGFDLGIGLNTRYGDFYKKYCVDTKGDNENLKSFKKMLGSKEITEYPPIIDWADFETAFGKHSKEFSIETKEAYIERFENFVSKFNAYLEDEEKMADYSSNGALIAKTMKNAITTYYYIRKDDRVEIEKLYQSRNDRRIYNFVSFNYTNSVDTCAKILKNELKGDNSQEVGQIVHVHGYVDSNMIMGVNDVSQIVNPELSADYDVACELVKPQQNIDSRTGYDAEVTSIIDSSNIICIYGMSLGETDKKWWNLISKWLAANNSRKLVILKYDTNYNARFTYTQRKSTAESINRFLKYSDLSDEKKLEIAKRIYIGANHNVFSMDLRKKSNSKCEIELNNSSDEEPELALAK